MALTCQRPAIAALVNGDSHSNCSTTVEPATKSGLGTGRPAVETRQREMTRRSPPTVRTVSTHSPGGRLSSGEKVSTRDPLLWSTSEPRVPSMSPSPSPSPPDSSSPKVRESPHESQPGPRMTTTRANGSTSRVPLLGNSRAKQSSEGGSGEQPRTSAHSSKAGRLEGQTTPWLVGRARTP